MPASALADSGNYEVLVANDLGSDESKAVFTVESPLSFLTPLKDQSVIEGERVEFEVQTNIPARIVRWYRNGTELKPDANRVEITQDGQKLQLVLKWAQADDQADYKVQVENAAGQVDSSAKLTVKKKLAEPPKILKDLENAVVAKGDALIFEVKVQGEITEVKWLKDGKDASKMANVKLDKVDDQT